MATRYTIRNVLRIILGLIIIAFGLWAYMPVMYNGFASVLFGYIFGIIPIVGINLFLLSGIGFLSDKLKRPRLLFLIIGVLSCSSFFYAQFNVLRGHTQARMESDPNYAIQEYTRSIEKNPLYSKTLHFERAQVYYSVGKYEDAISDYRAAMPDINGDQLQYLGIINSYVQLKQYEQALKVLDEFVNSNDKTVAEGGGPYERQQLIRGGIYYVKGDFAQAAKEFQTLVDHTKISPKDNYVYYNFSVALGNAYANLNNHNQALLAYNNALFMVKPIDKGNALRSEVLLKRGDYYFFVNDYDDAVNDYTEIINTPKANWSIVDKAHFFRAIIYIKQKKYNLALADLNASDWIQQHDYYAHQLRLYVYQEQNDQAALKEERAKKYREDQVYNKRFSFLNINGLYLFNDDDPMARINYSTK